MMDKSDGEGRLLDGVGVELPLSDAQLEEARGALKLFEEFSFGVVIASRDDARVLAEAALESSRAAAGISLFVQEVDFSDLTSIEKFLRYWSNNDELLDYLHEGSLDPKRLGEYGFDKYPLFLFINPLTLGLIAEEYLGSRDMSDRANEILRRICKHGRINVAVTPDVFGNTGSLWATVPEAYRNALLNPDETTIKEKLAEYLRSKSGFVKLGLTERVEYHRMIRVPTSEAIKKVIAT